MVGLVAALRLCEVGHQVTVFERDSAPGGLAASFQPFCDSDPIERYYHHIFKSDRRIVALIKELGLAGELFWSKPVTACLCNGRLARLDTAASVLSFAPLGAVDRWRLAFALALLKLAPNPAPFHRVRATDWLRRVAGATAFHTVFDPLFNAKFGAHADDISLAWFWARIHDRTTSLGYLRGGFHVLYQRLVARIREAGGRVVYRGNIRAIDPCENGFRLHADGVDSSATYRFERVIATTPLHGLLAICPALPNWFAERYAKRRGLMARSVVLALDRPLADAYWINMCDRDAPFAVAVCHSSLAGTTCYGRREFVFLGAYGTAFPDRSVRRLVEESTPYLRRLNPGFTPSWILGAWEFVAADAQPIVTPGYRDGIPPHETPLKGLYLANLSQVYPHDRGQNYAIALAESVVKLLVAQK